VYNLDAATNQFYLKHAITNAHNDDGVAMVDGEISLVVSCGITDTDVEIFSYNITLDLYQLIQTLTGAVISCTAIDLAKK
jgi:hypothetical protein